MKNYGLSLKKRMSSSKVMQLIGVYDVFSAVLAERKFEAIFCSGYGFSASYYGFPDEGFIAWTDMVSYVRRIRATSNDVHIVVDIDNGHGDKHMAALFAKQLEDVGASAVILEDQRMPKKCGHLPEKELIPLSEYIPKLEMVLSVCNDMLIIARTDATDINEGIERAKAFVKSGAHGVLIEGITDIGLISKIRKEIGDDVILVVNVIKGGKTPPIKTKDLVNLGVNIINYSTPCLFAAHSAIDDVLDQLKSEEGSIECCNGVDLDCNNSVLVRTIGKNFNKS